MTGHSKNGFQTRLLPPAGMRRVGKEGTEAKRTLTTKGYYSFERMNDLKRLKKSKKYVPGYMQVEEIKKAAEKIGVKKGKKEGEKIGVEKGKKEGKIEMAKESLKEGLSIELISKLTGLSKEEIEKL